MRGKETKEAPLAGGNPFRSLLNTDSFFSWKFKVGIVFKGDHYVSAGVFPMLRPLSSAADFP